jgi:hypothetical protein
VSGGTRASDDAGELNGIVEKVERREIVASAGIVLAAFTYAIEDTAIMAGRGLARLHIKVIGMQSHLAGNGDSPLIGPQVK